MRKSDSSATRSGRARSGNAWQIRIDLTGIRPPVWRRVLVSDRITLLDLHRVIQAAFGWSDSHLHDFTIGGRQYGDPATDEFGDFDLTDEAKTRLERLTLWEGERFTYTYDFGDGWVHALRIEKILQREAMGAAVESMVVDPLVDFGAITTGYVKGPSGDAERRKPAAFTLTNFGRVLLEALP